MIAFIAIATVGFGIFNDDIKVNGQPGKQVIYLPVDNRYQNYWNSFCVAAQFAIC